MNSCHLLLQYCNVLRLVALEGVEDKETCCQELLHCSYFGPDKQRKGQLSLALW